MGSVVKAYTEKIDIMPTVLDLLDLDIPLQCDDHSLKTFLCGKILMNGIRRYTGILIFAM